MATKTKDIPVTVAVSTGPFVTTDLNEYLMRTSEVNYKDRFNPSEETDKMTTSAVKMQKLVAIEPKYVKNKQGIDTDIGRSYFFEDVKLNLYPEPKEPVPEYKGPEPYVKQKKEEKKKIDEELLELENEEKKNAGGDALKTTYMIDYTEKDFYKGRPLKKGQKGKNVQGGNLKGKSGQSGFGQSGVGQSGVGGQSGVSGKKGGYGDDEDSEDEVREIDENDPNYEYYMKMKKLFSNSKTGKTIYKTDYCELNKRKKRNPHAQDV